MMDAEALATALADPEREPSGLEGVPGWRPVMDGRPHPADLRDIVASARRVCAPERVLLFGSGARGEMNADSDIDILVVSEAPEGALQLRSAIVGALPDLGLRWTDVLVLTPSGLRKRLVDWEDEALAELIGEATTLYEKDGG